MRQQVRAAISDADLCECGHEWSAHSRGADSTTCCASYCPTICTAYSPVSQDAKPAESGNPCECGHGLEVHGLASHHGSRCFSAGCLCTAYRPATPEPATDLCHCGDEVLADDTGATRGMCAHCDPFRCDVDPGNCGRCTSPQPEPTGLVERVMDALCTMPVQRDEAKAAALAVAAWLEEHPYRRGPASEAIRREVER